MREGGKQQHDIAQTLHLLLPVHGAPKTLRELRDQVRLLNEIRDPDDARLARIIVSYLRRSCFKVDADLSPGDLSAHWTRVRIGPSVSKAVTGDRGEPPGRKRVEERVTAIWTTFSESGQDSIYLWDLLKTHFGVTRDNNSNYRQWLETLADVLKADPRFVIIAVDSETSIPVEWMLAVDRATQVEDAVNRKLPQLIGFIQHDNQLIHLTRSLVHRFFSPHMTDETYDMHAYYEAVSEALAETPLMIEVFVHERTRQAAAWVARERIQAFIHRQMDDLASWLYAAGTSQSVTRITQMCFSPLRELVLVDHLREEVTRLLEQDLRFLFDKATGGWQTIPPGDSRNHAAYHVLCQQWHPLHNDILVEIVRERFPKQPVDLDLATDERFCSWRSGGWGLSQWIDINDLAYEHLRQHGTELKHAEIVAAVCAEYDVTPKLAVFSPEGDPRFGQRVDGKWFCQYPLTDADLDKMLELLSSANEGFALEDLVFWSIGFEASGTDAAKLVAGDDRFILVDGLWFARQAYHRLTEEDVDQLLAVLEIERTGMRLTTLVHRVLNRKASSTDAETRLRADSRFEELLPGVWAPRDLEFQSKERRPIFNLSIQSDQAPSVSEEELTLLEELTLRDGQSGDTRGAMRQRQVRRTLSYLDVEYGNLTIDRVIATLLDPDSGEMIHFTDEMGNEFTCWVDSKRNLVQGMGSWFQDRDLTYGDRIVLKPTSESAFLEIQPLGGRDERVYQEAMQRRDVEQLLESARQAKKSYHDLMIEVMDHLNDLAGESVPLHRETIYDLVNYSRTASRNTVFSLLSLSDCPYKELRYFVPHGGGYWSFDPERKKAFDMKMNELMSKVQELEDENERLRVKASTVQVDQGRDAAEVVKLTRQLQEQTMQTANLSARNSQLLQANENLAALGTAQHSQIQDLEAQVSTCKVQVADLTADMAVLRSDHESLQRERSEMSGIREMQSRQIEELLRDKAEMENDVARLEAEIEQATSRHSSLREEAERLETRLSELADANEVLRQEHQQVNARLGEIGILRETNEELQRDICDLHIQRDELLQSRETHKSRITELDDAISHLGEKVSALHADSLNLTSRNADLEERLRTLCTEKEDFQQEYERELGSLQAEIAAQRLEHEDLGRSADAERMKLNTALESELARTRELQERLDGLERLHRKKDSEIVRLTAKMERINSVMSTRSGRVFVSLSRLFGGPDLSDI